MGVMETTTWIFDDGLQQHPCATFPYAFRYMFNAIKRGVEKGKKHENMSQLYLIISPTGVIYNYDRAKSLATAQGLLTSEGTINSREFKRRQG